VEQVNGFAIMGDIDASMHLAKRTIAIFEDDARFRRTLVRVKVAKW
jgi:hypothetical protein